MMLGAPSATLAQMFVGQRGLRKQGQARDIEMEERAGMEADEQARKSESLARVMGGVLGRDVDPMDAATLSGNPNLMGAAIDQARPQEPKADPLSKPFSKPVELVNPDTGEVAGAVTPAEARELYSQGYRVPPKKTERRIVRGADGFNRYADTQERVFPGVEAAAADPQTVVNVTNQPNIEKSTKGQLEKKLIQSQESLGRMDQIVTDFKPEYLTIGDKVETTLLGWQEKVGMTLDPAQKKALADRATFFQKTFDSVNRAIRDMTGAQMSEGEADRLMRGMPNQDDAPTEFMAKMQSVIGQIKSYDRLYRETMSQGLGPAGEAAPQADPDPLGLF